MIGKELPIGWEELKIADFAKTSSGGTPSTTNKEFWDGDIPWINSGKLKDEPINSPSRYITVLGLKGSSAKLFPKGTTVIALTGATTGKVGLLEFETSTNQSVVGILPNNVLDNKLLFYQLQLLRSEILSSALGSAQPHINKKIVDELSVLVPPLPEQERIVAKLDSIFSHLEAAKQGLDKIPVLLKEFRQAVLTLAVTGKLTEEWREGKELEGVDCLLLEENRILEIENENFQLEKLGKRKQKETPFTVFGKNELGWLIVNVESACVFIVDCLHNTPQFESTGYSVIDTTCISPFKIDWDKARKVNSEYFEKWTERLTPNYRDILFSREGTIGIAVKVPEGAELCIGQRMMLFRMAKFVLPEYAEIYFNSFIFRDEYFPHIKGVAAQHLNIGSIRELPFPIPSFLEQTEIVRRVEALFSKADAIEAKYKKLKEQIDQLPQAVLAKAFRGEV